MFPPGITCVILAAGSSVRMGYDKLSARLADGTTLLERAIRACASFPTIVVTSTARADHIRASSMLALIRNDEPARGMSHSLRLADACVARGGSIAVLPADLPFIEEATVCAIAEASDGVDVTYPVSAAGSPGHPVIFSSQARRFLRDVPQGDTLRALRDHPSLSRRTIPIAGDGPFVDVDVPSDFRYGR